VCGCGVYMSMSEYLSLLKVTLIDKTGYNQRRFSFEEPWISISAIGGVT
jgi:hypothetical protein